MRVLAVGSSGAPALAPKREIPGGDTGDVLGLLVRSYRLSSIRSAVAQHAGEWRRAGHRAQDNDFQRTRHGRVNEYRAGTP